MAEKLSNSTTPQPTMNSKFLILASILIICAFVQETSAQYYGYSGYYPSYYGGYYGSGYGYGAEYAYPSAYGYYGKRSAGFHPRQQQQQQDN